MLMLKTTPGQFQLAISGVAIGGSAGSRNRGSQPLGAPSMHLVRQALNESWSRLIFAPVWHENV